MGVREWGEEAGSLWNNQIEWLGFGTTIHLFMLKFGSLLDTPGSFDRKRGGAINWLERKWKSKWKWKRWRLNQDVCVAVAVLRCFFQGNDFFRQTSLRYQPIQLRKRVWILMRTGELGHHTMRIPVHCYPCNASFRLKSVARIGPATRAAVKAKFRM